MNNICKYAVFVVIIKELIEIVNTLIGVEQDFEKDLIAVNCHIIHLHHITFSFRFHINICKYCPK